MSGVDPNEQRRLMAKAVQELRELRARLKEAEAIQKAPIAIIGMGCRFPGGADEPASFWDLVLEGRDATSDVPASRWNADDYYAADRDAPGKMVTRRGAFLRSFDELDAGFFGVSPLEAQSLDPQQRLWMEVAWEALEHAGLAPDALLGRPVGVYLGVCNAQHVCNQLDLSNIERIEAHHGTGCAFSVASGRLSHFLGLTGPAFAVDTACSSSLLAIHLACQSLRAGECELALAGGVNLLPGPQFGVIFSKARMLSPDGRCKTFAADADGYGRGEGCGAVVLRRLSDAVERGERVLAVVRGSAVNHDGRSSGLAVPNGAAQADVIRAALRHGDVDPSRVGYLEAHGTGTLLGDPIEVNALGEVFGSSHTRERPLLMGSVKANIGHLEAAAGISGLIKVVLALQHRTIPPHVLQGARNPDILWDELPFDLPARARPWPLSEGPRAAGVSAFGFSGTNVHIVVEEAPEVPVVEAQVERPAHVMALSAKSDGALRSLAAACQRRLSGGEVAVADACFTANVGRSHFRRRLCAVGRTAKELRDDIDRALEEATVTPPLVPAIAFLFTGQGSQEAGTGRALYETQPTFRRSVDRCAEILDPLLGQPIREVMFEERAGAALGQTAFAQPALFTLEYALAELWRAWGVRPAAVLGHDVGGYVAACVAGVMTLEEALRLIAARGRLMASLPDAALTAPIVDDLAREVAAVKLRLPAIPMVSNVTGALADEAITRPAYWAQQAREAARFADGVRALRELGCSAFLEVGPRPALITLAAACVAKDDGVRFIASLSAGQRDDWDVLLGAVSELYRAGAAIAWAGFDRDYPRRRVTMPTYPFDRQRYPVSIPAQRWPGTEAALSVVAEGPHDDD